MKPKENWVDYKAIKQQVSMQMVLDSYKIKLKRSGKNYVCCCPIHKGTNFRQFSVNLEKSIWQCFGDCQTGGNVLDFAAMMEFGNKEPSSIRQAALKLRNWFLLDSSAEEASVEVPATDEEKIFEVTTESAEDEQRKINKPLTFELKNLDPGHEWFNTRGILPETVKYFGLGLSFPASIRFKICSASSSEIGVGFSLPPKNPVTFAVSLTMCHVSSSSSILTSKYPG